MKNIIFDIGGVILRDKPSSILDKLNINKKDYNQLIMFFKNWEKLDLGQQSLEEKLIECNFPDYISSKYKDILLKYYEFRDINIDIIELIKKLKHNNYKIYVLSDNNLEAYKYFQKNTLFNDIDEWVVSCNYGATKRDGKLFEILLDKYKLLPQECYFIDDKDENINVAYKYNIKGFRFDDNFGIEQLYNDMKNNGILL